MLQPAESDPLLMPTTPPSHIYSSTRLLPPAALLCPCARSRVSVGFVVALDYRDPYLSPFQEFQQFKRHPLVQQHIKGGTCLQYGARTLNEGGLQLTACVCVCCPVCV